MTSQTSFPCFSLSLSFSPSLSFSICLTQWLLLLLAQERTKANIHFAIHHLVVSESTHFQCTLYTVKSGKRWICVCFLDPGVWQRLHIIYMSLALSLCRLARHVLVPILDSCSFVLFVCVNSIWKTNNRAHIWCMKWTVSRKSLFDYMLWVEFRFCK